MHVRHVSAAPRVLFPEGAGSACQWRLGPGRGADARLTDAHTLLRRVADNPKLGELREGLSLFISHFLLKGALGAAGEAGALRARADLAAKALRGRAAVRM